MKHALLLLAFATPALADDYALRDGDVAPSEQALTAQILDRDLEYFDGGLSRYNSDGSYEWRYAEANGGGLWEGTHQITGNTICVTFVTGGERCDMFVNAGERLVLLTSEGERFPVRDIR